MRRVLRLAAFRRLLAAYALNELALSIGSLALAVLVYRKTGSAIGATAFFLSAQFLPALVSPAIVARLDGRAMRDVLPGLYSLEAVAFVALAGVASSFALAPLLVLALADGVIALTARPLARSSTVSVTVPYGLLREGNAVLNGAFSLCFMTGPAIGGAIVAAGGTIHALIANSVLFAVMAVILATASGLPGPAKERPHSRGRLRAAVAHASKSPAIRTLLGLQTLALVFFTISIPVEVVFAQRTLHAGPGGYGGLLSAWGGGAVAGSALYARWRARSARSLIALGAGSLGVGFGLMAIAPNLALALAGAALAGCGNGIEAVAVRTTLQEQVEKSWMAMLMSLSESLMEIVPGAGILLGGALTVLASPRTALGVAAGGALLVAGMAWVALTPGRLRGADGAAVRDELGVARSEARTRRSSQARATRR